MNNWVGHAAAETALLEALRGERLHPVWLLTGPQGIGKASFAARASAFLLADGDRAAQGGAPTITLADDHPTMRLIASGAHGELLTLQRAVQDGEKGREPKLARNITVDQVRQLIGRMRTRPVASRWRAVIIDAIDDCERGAANALLKTLEEPPAQTVIFLISHAPARLLPTIRSRCRTLRFAALDDQAMRRWLRDTMPAASEDEHAALAAIAAGSPGRALTFAGPGISDSFAKLREIACTGDPHGTLRSDLAKSLAPLTARARFEAMLEQASILAAVTAKNRHGEELAAALSTYDAIAEIRRFALSASEDPATVSFAIGTALANLAQPLSTAGHRR